MLKTNLTQSLQQKLSPQQIQFIKLLQIPTAEIESRIEEELESNPALEDASYDDQDDMGSIETPETNSDADFEGNEGDDDYGYEDRESLDRYSDDYDLSISEYVNQEDIAGYKMQGDGPGGDDEDRDMPLAMVSTLTDSLLSQLGYLNLSERDEQIGKQLIGNIDEDGYIRRSIEAIANDIYSIVGVEVSEDEVIEVLQKIQRFEPAGIAATSLQECLVLQLEAKSQQIPGVAHALEIMRDCFDEFTKKHYPKIEKKLGITEDDLKEAISVITKLNPKPGGTTNTFVKNQYLIPDFILRNNNQKLELSLNSKNAPDLRISRSYHEMLDSYDKSNKKDKKLKETVSFVKQKLDAAKWFIDAIRQRQETLLKTMECIVYHQEEFFKDGDESKLKPMILKDIATKIGMDISTVSRVANSKCVQTDFGIFPLKHFFSESISTDSGEDVSSKEVKYIMKEIIEKESKKRPYSDDKIEKMLRDKGYNIARRTVAKYREQLNIPVARLRKEL